MTERKIFDDASVLSSYVHRAESPDGTVFTTIIENREGRPVEVLIQIGKTGTQMRSWSEALANAISVALRAGVELQNVIPVISGITTDRVRRFGDGIIIRSGPEAVAYALIKYLQAKSRERESLDDDWQSPMEFGDLSES
jgi:hypothetical protein